MSNQDQDNEVAPNPFLRFSGITDIERISQTKVAVIGAGGIGCPAALALAKNGVHDLCIMDFDRVATENLGTQLHGPKTIGVQKVISLRGMLRSQAPWCNLHLETSRFTSSYSGYEPEILIPAVDSLEARKEAFDYAQLNPHVKLIVDARMGAEVLTIYTVNPELDGGWYEPTLEGEALDAPCTAKSTFHCGLVAGGLVASVVKSYICNESSDGTATVEFTLDMRYLLGMGVTRNEKLEALEDEDDDC